MTPDRRDPLIEHGGGWRLPWDRSKDVNIGSRTQAATGGAVEKPDVRIPGIKAPALPRLERLYGGSEQAPAWKRWPVQGVVLIALLYHLAPQAAMFLTDGDPRNARGLLAFLGQVLPELFDVETRDWLVPGAAAWLWQPTMAALGAGLLRLVAVNSARRDPRGALWIAGAALAIDTATWLSVGLKLGGGAYSPAEAAALITLLKIEGAALLGLFFILAPAGKRRLGQTDAD